MKNLYRSFFMVLLCVSTMFAKAQVPVLNSYACDSAVIFLDFDGHRVSGTSWNYNGDINCEAATLNSTQITEIFNRVSEDYRPFNINITTDSTKYWAAKPNKRMRVILTISSSWYGSAGGVAYPFSFTYGDNTPCFVFTALLNNNVKMISEAAAHEAGHTLGLRHQSSYDANCVKTSDYHYGAGSGEIGWAPIMGVGYYKNFTLWHNGPNSLGCNSFQTDLAIISGPANGFGFRPDDHKDYADSASVANFSNNQFIVDGVIQQTGDKDLFKFIQTSLGTFQLNAIPYNVGTANSGSDLDLQVTLLNSTQTVLGSYNPGNMLSSVIDTLLPAGTYYVLVEGKGNQYAPEYASLGSYALQGNFAPNSALPLRKLELTGSVQRGQHEFNWIIDADETVIEQVLEASTDGRNFTVVSRPTSQSRSFSYTPSVSSNIQYRLIVQFDNGRKYFSNNIIIAGTANVVKPKVIGNSVNSSMNVSSPGAYTYSVHDLNGKTLSKGNISKGINTIVTNHLASGMYMIRFANGDEQMTEKFVKQ